MESPDYVLNPDGDIPIVLSNPGAPFPFPEEDSAEHNDTSSFPSTEEDSTEEHATSPTRSPTPEEKEPVTYLVSSKHLSLSSEYFLTALRGAWKENASAPGVKRWGAEDWDKETFLIFLRIIHGWGYALSEPPDFWMIEKIALIADYYRCTEPIYPFVCWWMADKDFSKSLKSKPFSRQHIVAAYINYVFSMEGLQLHWDYDCRGFKDATLLCIEKARGPLRTGDLPLPEPIIDAIEKTRRHYIEGVFEHIRDLYKGAHDKILGLCGPCRWQIRKTILRLVGKKAILALGRRGMWERFSRQEADEIMFSVHTMGQYLPKETKSGGLVVCSCELDLVNFPDFVGLFPEGLELADFRREVEDIVPTARASKMVHGGVIGSF